MTDAVNAVSPDEPLCWAVVPAAGVGSRMGTETPKQYLRLLGCTLLEHSIAALLACDRIKGVVVALHPQDSGAEDIALLDDARVRTAQGAQQRSGSVLAGLMALAEQASEHDWVLVHDAARPCVRQEDITRLIDAVMSQDIALNSGGILAEPVVDTVKEAGEGGIVRRTLDRDGLWRAQTPQMFRLGELREALQQAEQSGAAVTDEASAMELAGHPVLLVPGSRDNLKITVAGDLPLAAWYLEQRRQDAVP